MTTTSTQATTTTNPPIVLSGVEKSISQAILDALTGAPNSREIVLNQLGTMGVVTSKITPFLDSLDALKAVSVQNPSPEQVALFQNKLQDLHASAVAIVASQPGLENYQTDPLIRNNPLNQELISLLDRLQAELSNLDPSQAQDYFTNNANAYARLSTLMLDASYRANPLTPDEAKLHAVFENLFKAELDGGDTSTIQNQLVTAYTELGGNSALVPQTVAQSKAVTAIATPFPNFVESKKISAELTKLLDAITLLIKSQPGLENFQTDPSIQSDPQFAPFISYFDETSAKFRNMIDNPPLAYTYYSTEAEYRAARISALFIDASKKAVAKNELTSKCEQIHIAESFSKFFVSQIRHNDNANVTHDVHDDRITDHPK